MLAVAVAKLEARVSGPAGGGGARTAHELGASIGQKLQRSGTAALSMLRMPGEARRSRGDSAAFSPRFRGEDELAE